LLKITPVATRFYGAHPRFIDLPKATKLRTRRACSLWSACGKRYSARRRFYEAKKSGAASGSCRITALQKTLAFTCFVFFVDFVVPTLEVTVGYLPSFHNQVNESGMRPFTMAMKKESPSWHALRYNGPQMTFFITREDRV
jgi:hypothetical protein